MADAGYLQLVRPFTRDRQWRQPSGEHRKIKNSPSQISNARPCVSQTANIVPIKSLLNRCNWRRRTSKELQRRTEFRCFVSIVRNTKREIYSVIENNIFHRVIIFQYKAQGQIVAKLVRADLCPLTTAEIIVIKV